MNQPLTEDQANAVYDALVEHAGALEEGRKGFVYLQTNGHLPEYRFIGSLGYGGKFWRMTGIRRGDPDLQWSVSAYREDMTPERQAVIDATNTALAALKQEET